MLWLGIVQKKKKINTLYGLNKLKINNQKKT